MGGLSIEKVVSSVDFLTIQGDIMDFTQMEVFPKDIFYTDYVLNVGGLGLLVRDGRYAFAQALNNFDEDFDYLIGWPDEIGKHCTLGSAGFGYVRHEGKILRIKHFGKVEIGKEVSLHNHVNIDRGVIGFTVIGDYCKIDSFCHIAHNVRMGKGNTLAAHTIIEGSCVVGDDNTFGTGVIVQRKVVVGSGNVFGSGAVVTKDTGDNGIWVGNPARRIRDAAKGI